MVFISHTHQDKHLVEPIAESLRAVLGEHQVFYDSWSIQPGDGIVDKMSEALAGCRFFFFFVSKRSLQSQMVKLEWQNAVLKATKGETRVIPVKLDDCLMPAVLLQTLYIDFFGQGPENALRQMVDVIGGKNTYQTGQFSGYQNVRAYISQVGSDVDLEFRAEAYMEPHSQYLVLLNNTKDELTWKATGENMFNSGFQDAVKLNDGTTANALLIGRDTPTTPGFPFNVKLTPTGSAPIRVLGAMRAVSRGKFAGVPVVEITA